MMFEKTRKPVSRAAYDQDKPLFLMLQEYDNTPLMRCAAHDLEQLPAAEPAVSEGAKVQPLPADFAPSVDMVDYLHKHHGIPMEFIAEQLVDFTLYWRETGEARKAWQNKFKNHVVYRWQRSISDNSEANLNHENSQRAHRTTVDKLTDTRWADDDWLTHLEESST